MDKLDIGTHFDVSKEKHEQRKIELTQAELEIFQSVRGMQLDEGMRIKEIQGIKINSGPVEVWIEGKKYKMDTAMENFGELLGEAEYKDSERMSAEEAQAEARLIQYYAKLNHWDNTKDLLYGNDEVSTEEYAIADEFLTDLNADQKKNLILKVKSFFYKSILPNIFPKDKIGKI